MGKGRSGGLTAFLGVAFFFSAAAAFFLAFASLFPCSVRWVMRVARQNEGRISFQTTHNSRWGRKRCAHLLDDIVQGDVHFGDATIGGAHSKPAKGKGCE